MAISWPAERLLASEKTLFHSLSVDYYTFIGTSTEIINSADLKTEI